MNIGYPRVSGEFLLGIRRMRLSPSAGSREGRRLLRQSYDSRVLAVALDIKPKEDCSFIKVELSGSCREEVTGEYAVFGEEIMSNSIGFPCLILNIFRLIISPSSVKRFVFLGNILIRIILVTVLHFLILGGKRLNYDVFKKVPPAASLSHVFNTRERRHESHIQTPPQS